MSNRKLQSLLISYLHRHGHVRLALPDGVTLEIGVDQVGLDGELRPADDYCWVMATRQDRMAVLDSYNVGIRFADDAVVYEDEFVNSTGDHLHRLDVV